MTRSRRILIALLAAYVAAYSAVSLIRAFRAQADPHRFMRDPARCSTCHLGEAPEQGRPYRLLNFRRDIVSLCTDCHARTLSHPVDIAPGKGMSKRLPLDPDGTMTCITCHAPHSSPEDEMRYTGRTLSEKIWDSVFPFTRRYWRTALLRMPNPQGELCESCHSRERLSAGPDRFVSGKVIRPPDPSRYAGSRSCSVCHPALYRLWRNTAHARMVRSPRRTPSAVLAAFAGGEPFPPSEIAYVLGSRNVQRFVSRKEDTLVVRTPIWMIRAGRWNLSYWREMDWLKACAGCHTTGYDPYSGRYAEASVSCEACHGPGRRHAETGEPDLIVNPGNLPEERREMICESCHTTGHDRTGEFRFPVGFLPGEDLGLYFVGLVPKPGQDDDSFRGDGTVEDRHRQFAYWKSRMLILEGETCDLCKNFRLALAGGRDRGPRRMTPDEYCRSCHDGTVVPPPPHHERARGACLSCHPAAAEGASVHDHRYIPPEAIAKKDFLPSPDFRSICFACHPAPGKGV
ncbi:MAG: hypothetical protein Kow00128_10710 [Deltaproteobacteria bacterium]